MLMSAFRPQRQLPDRPLRTWPSVLLVGFEVGAICLGGSHRGCPSADFAPSAQRSVSAFGALGTSANIVLTFFLNAWLLPLTS